MTTSKYKDLKARTEAWLQTDLKEYKTGVSLLLEWIHEDTSVRSIKWGDPNRYKTVLQRYLTKLAQLTSYPKLIDTPEKRDKLYIAHLPYEDDKQNPEHKAKLVVTPPEPKAEWDRYAHLEEYYDKLSPALQKKADVIPDMFANRTRLHETIKRYKSENVQPEMIMQNLEDLSRQEAAIQAVYDEFERFFTNGPEPEYFEVAAGAKPSGVFTKEEIDRMQDPVFAALCRSKRIEANKKYITRSDINNPEQLKLRRKELEEWGEVEIEKPTDAND